MMEKVWITGIGVIAPNGKNVDEYWQSLLSKRIAPVEYPGVSKEYMENRLFYMTPNWNMKNKISGEKTFGRITDFTFEAVKMALNDAGITKDFEEIGVSVGTGMADNEIIDLKREKGQELNLYESFCFNLDSFVAERFGFTGPIISTSTACSASAYGLSIATEEIRQGNIDVIVVIGAEGYLRVADGCFNRMSALDTECCRPFDANRKGTLFGEGSAVMILESKTHALNRGKKEFYSEIAGSGWSCDAYHPTAPDPAGEQTEAAVRKALIDGNLTPDSIDCIIPHATGTELNDVVESEVLNKVFGDRLMEIPVFALKSHIGHGGGAAGAFSCLTGALIFKHTVIPPTLNWSMVDPRCNIKLSQKIIKKSVNYILANVYGFGGNNISIILRKGNVS
jgi:3-oxoacyl-[acyl-carrier-protein] synthase II